MITSLLPKITKITQAVKHKDRVHIELDGKYWVTITKDQLVKLGLYKGQSIEAEEKNEIENQATLQKVMNKVLDYIAVRPRSIREVERYLEKKELDEFKEEVLLYLKEKKYLDDEEFTKWLCRE
jgi:regulatory protein